MLLCLFVCIDSCIVLLANFEFRSCVLTWYGEKLVAVCSYLVCGNFRSCVNRDMNYRCRWFVLGVWSLEEFCKWRYEVVCSLGACAANPGVMFSWCIFTLVVVCSRS